MPEVPRPRCCALVASGDSAWSEALVERLAAAEGGIGETAVACDLDFRSEATEEGLYGILATDGAVQLLILDALAFAEVRAVLARCRALRSELDVFVAVGAGDAAALEGADAALVDRDETRADTLLRRLHRAIDKRAATPFADTLRDYVEGARDAWHTPGHSSGDGLRDSPWVAGFYRLMGEHVFNADLSVSVQELDSLLEPSHVIQRAQDLAAAAFGAQRTFFVTGGTSMANKVVVQHLVGGGGKVLVDQGCHKSIHHAMVLFGADPV